MQSRRDARVPGKVQRQPLERDRIEAEARSGTQPQADRSLDLLADSQFPRKLRRIGKILPLEELDRPQLDAVGGAKFARGRTPRRARGTGAQNAPARHLQPLGKAALGKIGLESHHRHGRRRREEARKDHLQQVLAKGREFRVDLELHPRRKEGEAFEQALDIGIGAVQPLQRQPAGNLRKLFGEFGRRLPDMQQLVVVVIEEPGIH